MEKYGIRIVAYNSSAVFLDTAYIHALINNRDQWHTAALQWQERLLRQPRGIISTEFILIEIANSLASVRFRSFALRATTVLRLDPDIEIIPVSPELVESGLALYEQRQDKDWGLTDCTSFVVMTSRNLTTALTTDDHFRQAGFRPLLLDSGI
jgi:predicted nucleic acid-binding protein